VALWLGLGNLALGCLLLRAARTGVDPYDADEDTSASVGGDQEER